MGSIAKGILGGFSGKVGTVIGGTWKGIDFMRSRPSRTNRPATAKQLVQHAKFSLATKFVATMNKLLMVTFNNYAIEMTGTNSALSYLLKNAITGVYPNLAIDYASVLVSRGDLPNATNPIAAAAGGGIIKFTWTANVGVGIAKDTDKAVMVVYCNELKTSLYTYTGKYPEK